MKDDKQMVSARITNDQVKRIAEISAMLGGIGRTAFISMAIEEKLIRHEKK